MTVRLASALSTHLHLRGPRVLCRKDGHPLTQKNIRDLVQRAARRSFARRDGVHVLRHTFCSHLAMRGAPARAIQELAGHKDLSTTQRYMHLSPAAIEGAIRLLDRPESGHGSVAVGTPVARRPPHRSGRAALPHPAPTSGFDDAKTHEGIRMADARGR